MKRNDFLQNLLLIILSAVLTACIVNLACLGALPVTFTSHACIQLTGEGLHTSDVREFAGYIESDESLRAKVKDACGGDGASGNADIAYQVTATTVPDTGKIDIYVKSDDPYTSHDIAAAMVAAAYDDYPAAHTGVFVHLVEAASVAVESDPLPVTRYTIMGAILGAVFGAFLAYAAVRREREMRRRNKPADPRFARIEEPDDEAFDDLFAEGNEDVDPEMRELYRMAKRGGAAGEYQAPAVESAHQEETVPEEDGEQPVSGDSSEESHMSREAEAAYLEAMEIEAMAADEKDGADPRPTSDAGREGGDPYEE